MEHIQHNADCVERQAVIKRTIYYWGWLYLNGRWVHIYPVIDLKWCYSGISSRLIYEKVDIAPIAITSCDNKNPHTLEYYRDCSPDLLHKLLKGK